MRPTDVSDQMTPEALPPAIQSWLDATATDARRRGLLDLIAMLETLARATAAVRRGSWNDEAAGRTPPQ